MPGSCESGATRSPATPIGRGATGAPGISGPVTNLERGEALVLIAPSAVVPQELNVMLNPAHPRMTDVRIIASTRFRFDPRLAVALE
jgi:hypothetical protein